jgi:hypothetical protein
MEVQDTPLHKQYSLQQMPRGPFLQIGIRLTIKLKQLAVAVAARQVTPPLAAALAAAAAHTQRQ